jgi:hypothetical protein
MTGSGDRKNRMLDLVLEALNEAKSTKSEFSKKLLEMVLLNEMDQANPSVRPRVAGRHAGLN